MVYDYGMSEHEHSADNCKQCLRSNEARDAVRDLAIALSKLQKVAAPVLQGYEQTRRGHLRCALCEILCGPSHTVQELVPEPLIPRARGQKRYDVCSLCYQHLKKVRRSVPQQRNYSKALDLMIRDDEEGDEESLDA
jgi:hypothetical protein